MPVEAIAPGMYVRFSDRVRTEDPADGGGDFGLVGDPLPVGGFVALRAWTGMGVYGPEDMTQVSREDVPPAELADLDARTR